MTTASSPYACVGKRDEKYFVCKSGENHVEQCNSLELAGMICPVQRGKQQTHTHNSCTWKAKLLFNCYLDSKLPRSRFCSFHALCRGVLSFGHFADDDACAGVGLYLLEDVEKKSGQATTTTKSRLFPEEIDNWLLLAPGLVTVSSSLFFQPIIITIIIIFKSQLVIHHYSSGESGRS
ncbi:hypothetical protein T07_5660 [Trichinella nelsoni]|uniref:Uncharacterized protein n=1 Tax=Trichinella nelsoni TaxID=6336 RepID=A0A0V0SA90_9BILA|nr:hypothetical protein T07_5660 [Trichinella nelsoni]